MAGRDVKATAAPRPSKAIVFSIAFFSKASFSLMLP
jgi:hypothetical protein